MAISGNDPAQMGARMGVARMGTARMGAAGPIAWMRALVAATTNWIIIKRA